MSFITRLKYVRSVSGLSQEKFALKVGIKVKTYAVYEEGRAKPPYETLIKIAEIAGCTTDYLLGVDDNPPVALKQLAARFASASPGVKECVLKLLDM